MLLKKMLGKYLSARVCMQHFAQKGFNLDS